MSFTKFISKLFLATVDGEFSYIECKTKYIILLKNISPNINKKLKKKTSNKMIKKNIDYDVRHIVK